MSTKCSHKRCLSILVVIQRFCVQYLDMTHVEPTHISNVDNIRITEHSWQHILDFFGRGKPGRATLIHDRLAQNLCMSKYNSWHRSAKWITGYHPHLFHWLPRKRVRFQIQRPTSKQAITFRIITAQFSFYIKNMNSAAETYYLTNVMHQNGWQTWWSYTYIVVPPIYSLADTGLSLWLIQSTCKVAGQCERSDKIGKIKSYILAFKYDTVTEMGDNWRELCSWGQWPIHKPALLPMVISYHTQEIKKTSAV